jgi:hypothetical protein
VPRGETAGAEVAVPQPGGGYCNCGKERGRECGSAPALGGFWGRL